MEDLDVRAQGDRGGQPGHVTLHQQDHVGGRDGVGSLGPSGHVHRVPCGHGHRAAFQPARHEDAGEVGEVNGGREPIGGAADPGGHQHRRFGRGERGGDLRDSVRGRRGRHRHRKAADPGLIERRGVHQHVAGDRQVRHARRGTRGDLQGAADRPVEHLRPGDLLDPLGVTADDPRLVGYVLLPLDRGVPAAGGVCFLAVGGLARDDDYPGPVAQHIVHLRAQVLRAGVHVHEDRLRPPRHLPVRVRGRERHALESRQEHRRGRQPGLRQGVNRLLHRGGVGPWIKEQVLHPVRRQQGHKMLGRSLQVHTRMISRAPRPRQAFLWQAPRTVPEPGRLHQWARLD